MKNTVRLSFLFSWTVVAACAVLCLLSVGTVKAQDGGDDDDDSDLSVTITEDSSSIIYDDDDNGFLIIDGSSDGSTSFNFDCTVQEDPSGTFYYKWDFGSGAPSASDDPSTDSGAGPISFDSGTQVTVNVQDQLEDGTVCASGSDTITVSSCTIDYDIYNSSDSYDGPIYGYIDSDDAFDDDGNYKVKADITVSTNSCISSGDLGTFDSDNDDVSFLDDNGNEVADANTDESGMIRITIETPYSTDNLTVTID